MGIGHDHGAVSAGGRHRHRLAVTFALVAAFFGVELGYGIVSGSLALVSDAGHMAADVVALGATLVATRWATRPDPTGRRTYGSYRAEVFATGLTVLIMLGVAVYVVVEALRRVGAEPMVHPVPLIVVGALGLVVNVVSVLVLRAGATEALSVRGAYYEVVADAVGSVGVVLAGVLVALTGAVLWDTVLALAIGAFVAVRAVLLGRQVLAVLGQHVPAGAEPATIAEDLRRLDGVREVHDLHLWSLTSGMDVATTHLVLTGTAPAQTVLEAAKACLRDRHGIAHATVQVEARPGADCHELDW